MVVVSSMLAILFSANHISTTIEDENVSKLVDEVKSTK